MTSFPPISQGRPFSSPSGKSSSSSDYLYRNTNKSSSLPPILLTLEALSNEGRTSFHRRDSFEQEEFPVASMPKKSLSLAEEAEEASKGLKSGKLFTLDMQYAQNVINDIDQEIQNKGQSTDQGLENDIKALQKLREALKAQLQEVEKAAKQRAKYNNSQDSEDGHAELNDGQHAVSGMNSGGSGNLGNRFKPHSA